MDLNSVLKAEELSDEVLAEITQQLEQTSGQKAREELFTRVAKEHNLDREVVLKHFLKFIQDGLDEEESLGEETEDDYQEEEFSSGDEQFFDKSTVKIDRKSSTGVFSFPKTMRDVPKSKSKTVRKIKPELIRLAYETSPVGFARRLKCQECGLIVEMDEEEIAKGICAECEEKQISANSKISKIPSARPTWSQEAVPPRKGQGTEEKFSRPGDKVEI